MNASFYLVIQGARKFDWSPPSLGSVRVTKNRPKVASDEVAILVDLGIPDALFDRPVLEVKASIPNGAGMGAVISAEVADNIAAIIREQTGLAVRISPVGGGEQ